mmetsp:Transcript_477/g.1152  ORF Transcript_477/g.1152 Transcript_477/m.1152 type:complete len:317 (+) Transcript_477:691-1641(+)
MMEKLANLRGCLLASSYCLLRKVLDRAFNTAIRGIVDMTDPIIRSSIKQLVRWTYRGSHKHSSVARVRLQHHTCHRDEECTSSTRHQYHGAGWGVERDHRMKIGTPAFTEGISGWNNRGAIAAAQFQGSHGDWAENVQNLRSLGIPDASRPIRRAGKDPNKQFINNRVVACIDIRDMSSKFFQHSTCPESELAAGCVVTGSQHVCAISIQLECGHCRPRMCNNLPQTFSSIQSPNLDSSFAISSCKHGTIVRECHGHDGRVVTHKLLLLLVRQIHAKFAESLFGIPNLDQSVGGTGHKTRSITQEHCTLSCGFFPK